MNNEERRELLAVARSYAYDHASEAEHEFAETEPLMRSVNTNAAMASMWANVAQALKTGDAAADS